MRDFNPKDKSNVIFFNVPNKFNSNSDDNIIKTLGISASSLIGLHDTFFFDVLKNKRFRVSSDLDSEFSNRRCDFMIGFEKWEHDLAKSEYDDFPDYRDVLGSINIIDSFDFEEDKSLHSYIVDIVINFPFLDGISKNYKGINGSKYFLLTKECLSCVEFLGLENKHYIFICEDKFYILNSEFCFFDYNGNIAFDYFGRHGDFIILRISEKYLILDLNMKFIEINGNKEFKKVVEDNFGRIVVFCNNKRHIL
jgi:hypothetical protein